MKIKVVTGFSPSGFIEYGERFLKTFEKHWPKDIQLAVYVEKPIAITSMRMTPVPLWECYGAMSFVSRHRDDAEKNGRKPNERWKERHKRGGYNFRFDAVKFCRQCFIPRDAAASMQDGDLLVWLDADVITFDTPPNGFLESLIGDADISFLGRARMHSEIGYWSVRLNPRTRAFLEEFGAMWDSDRVFELPEWHSAFVFDHVRREAGLIERNLTPHGTGHVWFQSPLGKYTDHCKGARKALGHSPERKS